MVCILQNSHSTYSTILRDCNVCMYAVAFVVSSMHAASFKPLHPLSCTRTLLYSRSCIDAAAEKHPDDVMRFCWRTHENVSLWGFVLRFCRKCRTHENESQWGFCIKIWSQVPKIQSQVPDRWAGVGRSGGPGWLAGPGWRAWPGWGWGWARGVGDVRVPT